MYSLSAYSLGFTAESRARLLRERMLRSVEKDSREGRPTRLPFLKKHLCGQDVPFSIQAAPDFQEGTVLTIRSGSKKSRYAEFFDRICAFNRSAMASGLQAVPQEQSRGELLRLRVSRCRTEAVGDMLVSYVPDTFKGAPEDTIAGYLPQAHQAFIFIDTGREMAHECEHAVQYGICHMAGLPVMRTLDAEYLSMLLGFMRFDDPKIILRALTAGFGPVDAGSAGRPHLVASFRFTHRLKSRYGMNEDDIIGGMAYMKKPARKPIDAGGAAYRERMRQVKEALLRHAEEEFERTYEHVFGLPLKAIKEIIAGIEL